MPRHRFNNQTAKDYLLRYGYTMDPNFTYTNMNTRFRVYDLINERYQNYSMRQILYRTERATTRGPGFDSEGLNHICNIDFQPGHSSLDKQTRQEMYDFINSIESQPGRTELDKQTRKNMYDFINSIEAQQTSHVQLDKKTQYERFKRETDEILNYNPESREYINNKYHNNEKDANHIKAAIKKQLPNIKKQLQKALNNNETIIFDAPKDSGINKDTFRQSIILALQMLQKERLTKNVDILLTSRDGTQKPFYLKEATIPLLNQALFTDNIPDANDSNTEILNSYLNSYLVKDLATITFEISPQKQLNRKSAGFFPFINKSNINLEQYGIYSNINDVDLSESCLITAIKQSHQLSSEEIERLKHFIKTRTYLLENLPQICNEFNITFNLRIVSEFGTVSNRSYGNSTRSIPLIVMLGHYMIDTKLIKRLILLYQQLRRM